MDQQVQRKRKRSVLETVQEDDGNSKFARALGSVDYQTREKGLQALTIWLSKKDDLTEQELNRLWKGIFYCFWHADRAAFQADLAVRLAEILPTLSEKVAFLYFTVFLSTMRREWFGIDRLRLDKFMMLVRKFVRALFQYLQAQQWELEIVTKFMSHIQTDVLLSTDSHPAAGLMYHIADVFVVELKEVCRGNAPSAPVLQALLEPFCQVLAQTNRAAFLPRLRDAVFDVVSDEVLHPSEQMPLQHLAVDELAEHLFQLGASSGTHAKNRQELYEASKALEQAARKSQASSAKQAKKGLSPQQRSIAKAGSSATKSEPSSNAMLASAGVSKKHKAAPVAGNASAIDSVESPDTFAKEATAALHQAAAEMPQAALAQVNGKQLKKLKKKKKRTASITDALPEQTLLSEQKHQAQLMGAAEAVPLKLKQKKLAQKQSDAELEDMAAALQSHQLSNGKPAKKHKKGSGAGIAGQQDTSKADSVCNGHVMNSHGPATQEKKRVRFAMKRNLLMQIGGAVPPEEIRTPPDSRPKGSALKRSSLLDHREHQMKSSGSKNKSQKQKGNAKSSNTPKTAQAKLFF